MPINNASELNVQKFLKNHSLNDLKIHFGVEYRISDYKFLLNYNQIEARSGCAIADECRGLILRKIDASKIEIDSPIGETKILCFPFRRFYNYNDPSAAQIDWESAEIQEKLDGSNVNVYYDDIKKEWHASTRNVPEADTSVHGFNFTFRDLFEKALATQWSGSSFQRITDYFPLNEKFNYMFELCSPYNRIVVPYDTCQIFLLGMRELSSLNEYKYLDWHFKKPKTFSFRQLDDIVEFVNSQDPLKQEGVVIVDKFYNRIKIKNITYITYNKLHDTLGDSYRNCLTVILEEKVDDLLGKLPKPIEGELIDIQEKTKDYFSWMESQIFEQLQIIKNENHEPTRKKIFANWVSVQSSKNSTFWPAPAFGILNGQANSVLEWVLSTKKNGKYKRTILDVILKNIGYK